VEDTRSLTVPAGRSRREFPGVSASIRPETVGLSGRGLSVVEQNFDYDLLTPDKLMQSAVGDEIGMRLRTNRSFHGPADETPMILIGNGTGIAGLRAHLKARSPAGGGAWLLFGERTRAHDAFFDAELQAWLESGVLRRLDRAFSRDAGDGHFDARLRFFKGRDFPGLYPLRRSLAHILGQNQQRFRQRELPLCYENIHKRFLG